MPEKGRTDGRLRSLEEPKSLQEKHYTYIQLVLGKPWIRMADGKWPQFARDLHISLCYLPAMLESTINRHVEKLQEVVLQWVNTRAAPLERPYNSPLVPVRQIVRLNDEKGKLERRCLSLTWMSRK